MMGRKACFLKAGGHVQLPERFWDRRIIVDLGASPSRPNSRKDILPCITSRIGSSPPLVSCLGRRLNSNELLRPRIQSEKD